MYRLFQIGDFVLSIVCPDTIGFPPNFLLFEIEKGESEYFYTISLTKKLPQSMQPLITERQDIQIYSEANLESRKIGFSNRNDFYAYYQEISIQNAKIHISIEKLSVLNIDTIFTSLLALERRLIWKKALILHCAYTVYKGKAILFSAPSGTGKSTQAELWKQSRGSRIVNGDRALLRKIDGAWSACGWPVCGSSDICESEDTPLYTIVMLRQGETNHIERLSPIQAFTQLYAQTTINQWNPAFVQRAMELIEDLIGQVPVYQLTCNMTEDAVKCLEQAIFPEANTVEDDIEP